MMTSWHESTRMLSRFLSIYQWTFHLHIYKHSNPKVAIINTTALPIFGDIGSSPAMPTFLTLLHIIGKYPRRHLHTQSHSKQMEHHFYLSYFTQPMGRFKSATLLDFAVILQLLTVKKYSKIPYIWFTVNYCNTHCIMGISVLILQ